MLCTKYFSDKRHFESHNSLISLLSITICLASIISLRKVYTNQESMDECELDETLSKEKLNVQMLVGQHSY